MGKMEARFWSENESRPDLTVAYLRIAAGVLQWEQLYLQEQNRHVYHSTNERRTPPVFSSGGGKMRNTAIVLESWLGASEISLRWGWSESWIGRASKFWIPLPQGTVRNRDVEYTLPSRWGAL